MKRVFSLMCVCVVLLMCVTSCATKTVQTPEHRLQWWLADIKWDGERLSYTGKNVDIAILDTGIDATHPDLAGRVVSETKVSGLGIKEDETKEHGTGIAGVIVATPHDEKGALGVAPDANIISIDVTDDSSGKVVIKNLIDGIDLAVSKEVDIINISVGVKEGTEELHEAIKKAYDNGIIIIASAGNYMEDEILYPAAYDEVIAVGSLSKKHEYISPTGTKAAQKVVYLPGENIVSTSSFGEYKGFSGTSFSSGILTGMVAVSLEANQDSERTQKKVYSKMEELYGRIGISVNDVL
ncbi:MAG: S8 family serine peptidase [Clostridia bacterium]|nr:S8 family serine peptidase [Clostridia bacterium]MBQ7046683.1 S8 family serine peptidase [Oscillospiraceae bacterium]